MQMASTRVSFANGDGGIRTHVPVARQLDFESSSLWPLRYVSIFGAAAEKIFAVVPIYYKTAAGFRQPKIHF